MGKGGMVRLILGEDAWVEGEDREWRSPMSECIIIVSGFSGLLGRWEG